MKNINKKFLLVIVLLILNACGTPYLVPIGVRDSFYYFEGIKSEKINKNNRYCIVFDKTNIKNLSYPYNKKDLGFTISNFLQSKNIKINTNYLIKSIKNDELGYNKESIFIEDLKQEEIKNNFKNCDNLFIYSVWETIGNERSFIKEYYTIIVMNIFDTKKEEGVSWYSIDADGSKWGYRKIPPLEDFIDKGLNKWWKKYQE